MAGSKDLSSGTGQLMVWLSPGGGVVEVLNGFHYEPNQCSDNIVDLYFVPGALTIANKIVYISRTRRQDQVSLRPVSLST